MEQPGGESETPLLLVDGNNLVWPAHYRYPERIVGRSGEDVTGIYGFLATIRAALRYVSPPAECVVCFDGKRRAAGQTGGDEPRGKEAVPLRRIPVIVAGLDALGIRWLRPDGCIADDVIATLVRRRNGRTVYILSADRDFYQLLSESVRMLGAGLSGRRRTVGPEEVERRYGVSPRQWCDYVALTGRSSRPGRGGRRLRPAAAVALLAGGAGLEDLRRLGRLEAPESDWMRDRDGWTALLDRRSALMLRDDLDVEDVTTGRPTAALREPSWVLKQLGLM